MELNKDSIRQTYIQVLDNTLRKKLKVLEELLQLTEQHEIIFISENFSEEQFLQIVDHKEERISELSKLDQGFEQLYSNVQEELTLNKNRYTKEINEMKELITRITDISVKLQALEKRNKSKLEIILAKKRREIKTSRLSNQTVANYYKTISQQNKTESFFYDKKK